MATMDLGRLSNEDVVFKRKFRWTFNLSDYGIGPVGAVLSDNIGPGHIAKISSRPSISFNDEAVQHVIETVYLPSKPAWNAIDITCYDISGEDYLYQWLKLFYDPQEGTVNPAGQSLGLFGLFGYPKKLGGLNLLDGHGEIIESWQLQGCWPSSINWGDLDYSSSDTADITFSLRYDRAILTSS